MSTLTNKIAALVPFDIWDYDDLAFTITYEDTNIEDWVFVFKLTELNSLRKTYLDTTSEWMTKSGSVLEIKNMLLDVREKVIRAGFTLSMIVDNGVTLTHIDFLLNPKKHSNNGR